VGFDAEALEQRDMEIAKRIVVRAVEGQMLPVP